MLITVLEMMIMGETKLEDEDCSCIQLISRVDRISDSKSDYSD
jgi:hypothetical protein